MRLLSVVALSGIALASPPKTPAQAMKAVQALIDKEKTTACAAYWTHIAAKSTTMAGPPFLVTATVSSTKGSGSAIWSLSGTTTTPKNALARAIANGCK